MKWSERIRGRAFLTGLTCGLDRSLTEVFPGGSVTDFVGVPGDRGSIKINLVHRGGLVDWVGYVSDLLGYSGVGFGEFFDFIVDI